MSLLACGSEIYIEIFQSAPAVADAMMIDQQWTGGRDSAALGCMLPIG